MILPLVYSLQAEGSAERLRHRMAVDEIQVAVRWTESTSDGLRGHTFTGRYRQRGQRTTRIFN
jgi:hypothetical protein